jgi:hypothetical protein
MFRRAIGALFLLLILVQHTSARPLQAQDFRIAGTILDSGSGLPLARAEVSITSVGAGSAPVAPVTTLADADGRFLFANLRPGKYILSARCRGYAAQDFQQHESFSTAIAVGKDLDSENLRFLLTPAASIVGQVTNEFGEPVRNAQVMIFREGISNGKRAVHRQNQARTDDQGRYRISGLLPGHYYLAVSAVPWYARHPTPQARVVTGSTSISISPRLVQERNTALDVTYPITYYSGATDSSGASLITLQSGEAAVADFALQPVPALRMRFTVPGVDLSHGFQVDISQRMFDDDTPATVSTTFDQDSVDVGNVPAGALRINVHSFANGRAITVAQQEFQAGQGAQINLNQATAQMNVSGSVQASPGVKLPQPMAINLHDTRTGATFNAPVSPEGNFDFSAFAVKPGAYVLSLQNGSGFYVGRVQATGAKVSGRNVEFQGAEPVRLSVDVSAGLGSVSGITLLDGKPAAGAMILLIPRDAAPNTPPNASMDTSLDASRDTFLTRRDQSDSDGTFTLAGVAPGQYVLLAIAKGWDQEWANPSVLKQWMSGGQIVQVATSRESAVKVLVQ